MSFGIGVGDILKVSELALALWKACSEAPKEFSDLSHQLNSLQKVLKSLVDDVENPLSLLNRRGSDRVEEFKQVIKNIELVLLDVESIVMKYQPLDSGWKTVSAGRKKRGKGKVLDCLGFSTHDLGPLREKLVLHLTVITTFYDALHSSSLARIESHVEDIRNAIRVDEKGTAIIELEQKLRDQKDMSESAVTQVVGWIDCNGSCIGGWVLNTCKKCGSGQEPK
ncbi:hypothetical protein ONS95_008140 [Cadophora gregata]|nr:uncharacterized protein ONS95_008140 [Cadophora gregata]KAK0119293.1 hypothetical protein ONS96_012351 [Cadophora gregata f. sp. sojae]KAK0126547.1 hypothetical protein ONS95_008140 [Cadophora gregata]